MSEMKHHPAADAFPMMDEKRYAELVEDMKANGQQETILTHGGKVLDGRNRYRACVELGVTPKTKEYEGNPWDMAWRLNGLRRDLVSEQRYLIWKHISENSEEWQAEQRRIQEEANQKRAKAAKGNDNAAKERETEPAQSVQELNSSDTGDKSRQAKATASKTNRGAVERGDRLSNERPDLAEKVRLGEMKPAAAYRQMKKESVAGKVEPLPTNQYRVIYADPPWSYNDKQAVKGDYGTGTGAAEGHYPSMSVSELCALSVSELAADDAVLFLWVTSPLLPDGIKIADAWGFKYKASFVWDKVKHNMGHYNSVRHELLLICTRGSCTPDNVKLFDSVQSIERSDNHSEKPEEFREIIDTLYTSGSRIELFRRGDAPSGWDVWGNEADG